jgi:hypothetical protein
MPARLAAEGGASPGEGSRCALAHAVTRRVQAILDSTGQAADRPPGLRTPRRSTPGTAPWIRWIPTGRPVGQGSVADPSPGASPRGRRRLPSPDSPGRIGTARPGRPGAAPAGRVARAPAEA